MKTADQTEEPIDPLTDTGKYYLLMKRAVRDALAEEKKRFDPLRLVRHVASTIIKEIDERDK